MAAYAPRSLNAPVGCSDSAFTSTLPGPIRSGTRGVRRATSLSRFAAAWISSSDTRLDMAPGYVYLPSQTGLSQSVRTRFVSKFLRNLTRIVIFVIKTMMWGGTRRTSCGGSRRATRRIEWMGTVIACLLQERSRHSSALIQRRSPGGLLLVVSAASGHRAAIGGTGK
jgi:hypothetical protein